MTERFYRYLKNHTNLSEDEFEQITSICISRKLGKKEYLLQEGDVWRYYAFVDGGCLRTYRLDRDGREHILTFTVENHWTCDRESLLSGQPSRYNIEALEDSMLLLFAKQDMDSICETIPAFNDLVLHVLKEDLKNLEKRLDIVLTNNATKKYKNFKRSYPDFLNRVPQHMIASFLGISAETLSRIKKPK